MINNLLALLFLAAALILFIALTLLVRRGFEVELRPLSAYQTLLTQLGQAIESGGRIHMSMGSSGIVAEDTGTTLATLEMLDIVSESSSISDLSPVASTGNPTASLVINDIIRRAYRKRATLDRFDPTATRLVAFDPTTFAAGATSIVHDDNVRTNILMGSFGPESVLIAEAGRRQNVPQIIGSDRLETQAIAYVMADHALIGEEIFMTDAYVYKKDSALGSLLMQDILRWVIAVAILIGVLLATVGIL